MFMPLSTKQSAQRPVLRTHTRPGSSSLPATNLFDRPWTAL